MPPKTILFAMLNESGHLHPTFKLAKALRARGHDVRYLAVTDLAKLIEAQGFAVEPLFPELFPAGYVAADQALGTLARRRLITARYQALLERLRVGPPYDLARVRPDLLLVDVTQPHFALFAHRQRLRFIHLNTSLPQTRDPGVPPLRSGAPFGDSGVGRAKVALDWAKFLGKRRLGGELARLAGMCPPYELARREASAFSIARTELDWQTNYMPQLRGVPELVLCPEAFDFPRVPRRDRHYVESIDLERNEPQLAPGLVPGDERPLLYCAFGGQQYRTDDKRAFFARLIALMHERPRLHLLLALGKHVPAHVLGPLPANVTAVESVPQLAVLARASAMITHAGLGSVKECIVHGVPMLAVPLDVDQPGNAARIVHHGLGLAADVAKTTSAELGKRIDRVLGERVFRAQVRAMQTRFQTVERAQRGADLIEDALSSPPVRGVSQLG